MADLISLETYKQAKAITKSDSDERLGILISGVSQLVKTYCGNTFLDYIEDPKTEIVNVEYLNANVIQLREFPILNIVNVEERPSYDAAYVELTENTDFLVNYNTETLYRVGYSWPRGIASVKVMYTCGYEELPNDLELAVIDLVTYYHKEEHKKMQTIGSSTKVNVSTTSLKDNTGFPDHIRRVLDMYRPI